MTALLHLPYTCVYHPSTHLLNSALLQLSGAWDQREYHPLCLRCKLKRRFFLATSIARPSPFPVSLCFIPFFKEAPSPSLSGPTNYRLHQSIPPTLPVVQPHWKKRKWENWGRHFERRKEPRVLIQLLHPTPPHRARAYFTLRVQWAPQRERKGGGGLRTRTAAASFPHLIPGLTCYLSRWGEAAASLPLPSFKRLWEWAKGGRRASPSVGWGAGGWGTGVLPCVSRWGGRERPPTFASSPPSSYRTKTQTRNFRRRRLLPRHRARLHAAASLRGSRGCQAIMVEKEPKRRVPKLSRWGLWERSEVKETSRASIAVMPIGVETSQVTSRLVCVSCTQESSSLPLFLQDFSEPSEKVAVENQWVGQKVLLQSKFGNVMWLFRLPFAKLLRQHMSDVTRQI